MKTYLNTLTPILIVSSSLSSFAITVTNTDPNNVPGSLRAAISETIAGGTVDFAPDLNGERFVLTQQLFIGKELTIDASSLSDGITIDANASEGNRRRVMEIGSDANVTLNNLTLTGGWTEDGAIDIYGGDGADGGGLLIGTRSRVNLHACTVSQNQTGDGSGGFGGDGGGFFCER